MPPINGKTQLAPNFKEVYGPDIKELAPNTLRVTRAIEFEESTMVGGKYHQPVDLSYEHGITHAATKTTPTLLAASAALMEDAQVEGSQIFARSQVDYEAIYASALQGNKAFAKATKHVVKRLTKAAAKRVEVTNLHGRRGIGTLQSVSGATTSRDWIVTEGSWSAGLWAGMKGATLDVFAANFSGAKLNTNLAVTVAAINLDTRTVSVTGNATDLTAITAGMQVFFETASPTSDFAGIDAIGRNTGVLFGIDAAQYELWKGNVISSVGRLSMGAILNGIARCVERGLEDDTVCIVSPKAFEVLNQDQAALREYDSSYRPAEAVNGVSSIKFRSQVGTVEILSHLFQKDGQAHIVAFKEMKRIGATDLTFIERSGSGEERLIRELENQPASEMRCYYNGALFHEMPAHMATLDGITYL